jgi:hypothetical protein
MLQSGGWLQTRRPNDDGSTVYVYRAADVGTDVLIAAPKGLQTGECISCVTTHYFIKVVR